MEGGILHGTTEPLGRWGEYVYVAVLSRYRGRLLLSRHRERATWETQGGHIEPGESPEQAARRELYEEAGALEFTLKAVCDYSAAGTHGVFYVADIARLGPLPASEMAEVRQFAALPPPRQLTYPGITPVLYAAVRNYFEAGGAAGL